MPLHYKLFLKRVNPVIFCRSHGIHTTSLASVRKVLIAEKISRARSKSSTEDKIVTLPSSNNDCINFLGVENDHGVIFIDTNKENNSTPLPQQNNFRNELRAKFFSASFGVIRRDIDNNVKFHGQYQDNENEFFPHKSSSSAVVNRKLSDIFELASEDFEKDTKKRNIAEVNDSKYGFVDNQFFGSPGEPVGKIKDEDDLVNSCEGIVGNKSSFFDEHYFQSHEIEPESNKERVEDNSSMVESTHKSELKFLNEDSSEERILTEKGKNILKGSHNMENSYMDEHYFDLKKEEPVEISKDRSNNFEHLLKPIDKFATPSTNVTNTEARRNLDLNSLVTNCYTTSETNKNKYNTLGNAIGINNVEKKSSTNKQGLIVNNCSGIDNNKSHQLSVDGVNNIKDTLSADWEKKQINDLKPSSHLKYKEFSNLSVKKSDEQNVEKIASGTYEMENFVSSARSETSSLEKTNSALSFVYRLREEDKSHHLNGSQMPKIDKSEIRKDSKGFRILKHQVPDFTKYTTSEIVNHLKQQVLYSDDDLVILNKPYNLVMHDSQTNHEPGLSRYLDELSNCIDPPIYDSKLLTVHRLDKETTGCLLLARTDKMAQHLKSLFAERKIIKKYWIVTCRVPDPLEGIIDIPITEGSIDKKNRMVLRPILPKDIPYRNHSKGGKRAITKYKVVSISGNAALVEVTPETGIKHQIRVHFGFGLSCPILGDHKYSHLDKLAPQKLSTDILQRLSVRQSKVRYIPLHIHARSITIPGHLDGRDLFVMAPLPKHMSENLKMLKFRRK